MANSLLPDAVKRPPFANYDIVVYFGAGLFSVPFINRYISEPLGLNWPSFSIKMGSPIAQETVAILSLLFFVYILGHILAYVASQIIEKTVDRTFGKISTAIILSSQTSAQNRNTVIRALIYNRLSYVRKEKATFATVCRIACHAPALPFYIVLFALGVFGYYDTRVTPAVIDAVRHKINNVGLGNIDVSLKSRWYKILEYYVINRRPDAIPRMYNYLVISGLFRSICAIFLFSMWMSLYYCIHYRIDSEWFLKPAFGTAAPSTGMFEYLALSAAYIFSLFSYIKFQRRYAEEAIFAFVFGQD